MFNKSGDPMSDSNLPIAILAASGFEERHLTEVQKALLAREIPSKIISPDGGLVQGWHEDAWGHHFMADDSLSDILSTDFAALIVPAGARSAATLSKKQHTTRVLKAFIDAGKPVAVLGESGELLIGAEHAAGRTIAANETTREALSAAGATLSDDEITVDGTLITAASSININLFLDTFFTVVGAADEVERAA
jgi:protease I